MTQMLAGAEGPLCRAAAKSGEFMHQFVTRAAMTAAAALSVLGTGQAQAATHVFDISDAFSMDEQGSPFNQTFSQFVGANLDITGISYNLSYTAVNPSWLSEASIGVGPTGAPSQYFFQFSNEDNAGGGSYVGSVNVTGVSTGSDGILNLQLLEGFDDALGQADGQYGAGSTVTVSYADPVGAAPEPATWAMMLLGFGLAGYGLRRRTGSKPAFA